MTIFDVLIQEDFGFHQKIKIGNFFHACHNHSIFNFHLKLKNFQQQGGKSQKFEFLKKQTSILGKIKAFFILKRALFW